MTDFWKQLYTTCMERETTPNEVAKKLGISSGAVSNWKLKDVIPRGKTIEILADYFNVSVDYLLGKEKKPSDNGELEEYLEELRSNEDMRMMFSLCRGATKEDVAKAVEIVKAYLGK